MPRGIRLQQPGTICHLTHRCHDRQFLFRFGCDRSEYRERLRLISKEYDVSLINYSTTSNHTHEIAFESREEGISRMMQHLEGEFAAHYNRRKDRSGAFWEDRYHCTLIEDGEHLWNCIVYVDLNMVRAGVVTHPADWSWCGYRELIGEKKRYRLLDMDRVLELTGMPNHASFQAEYQSRIQAALAEKKFKRDERWTESIAIGNKDYVQKVAELGRRDGLKPRIEKSEDGSWSVWESSPEYSTLTPQIVRSEKRGPKSNLRAF